MYRVSSRGGRIIHDSSTALLAVAFLALSMPACGEPTGLPEPSELQKGSFRAEVAGAVERTLRGDSHLTFGNFANTNEPGWLLRLSYPTGTGQDSIRIVFGQKVELKQLPDEGTYPMKGYRIVPDSVAAAFVVNPDSSFGDEQVYFARSGTFTVTEAVAGEVLAGRFEFPATLSDRDETIEVIGTFRSGAPAQ